MTLHPNPPPQCAVNAPPTQRGEVGNRRDSGVRDHFSSSCSSGSLELPADNGMRPVQVWTGGDFHIRPCSLVAADTPNVSVVGSFPTPDAIFRPVSPVITHKREEGTRGRVARALRIPCRTPPRLSLRDSPIVHLPIYRLSRQEYSAHVLSNTSNRQV